MRLPRSLVLALAATVAAGCASTGARPQPFPRPGDRPGPAQPRPQPVPTTGSASAPDGYAIAGSALDLRGAPYRNGGADPRGFDCSGFIEYVFGQHGISMPRTVAELYETGQPIAGDDLRAGDLVFFAISGGGASHVGLSIGGDEFVHAPSAPGVVRVERLGTAYWSQRYVGARRVF